MSESTQLKMDFYRSHLQAIYDAIPTAAETTINPINRLAYVKEIANLALQGKVWTNEGIIQYIENVKREVSPC